MSTMKTFLCFEIVCKNVLVQPLPSFWVQVVFLFLPPLGWCCVPPVLSHPQRAEGDSNATQKGGKSSATPGMLCSPFFSSCFCLPHLSLCVWRRWLLALEVFPLSPVTSSSRARLLCSPLGSGAYTSFLYPQRCVPCAFTMIHT